MEVGKMQKIFLFLLAVILALFLAWFGFKFLFLPNDALGVTGLLILGVCLVISGVFMLSVTRFNKNEALTACFFIVSGFYLFARAGGIINIPWLARAIGLLCWTSAMLVLYITWPNRVNLKLKKKDRNELDEFSNPGL